MPFSKWTREIEILIFKCCYGLAETYPCGTCLNTWTLAGAAVLRGWITFRKLGLAEAGNCLILDTEVYETWLNWLKRLFKSKLGLMTMPHPFLPQTLLLNKASRFPAGSLNIFLFWILLNWMPPSTLPSPLKRDSHPVFPFSQWHFHPLVIQNSAQ